MILLRQNTLFNNFFRWLFNNPEDEICARELQSRHGDFPDDGAIRPHDNYADLCGAWRKFVDRGRSEAERKSAPSSGLQNAKSLDDFVRQMKSR